MKGGQVVNFAVDDNPTIVILNRLLVNNPCDAKIFSNPAGRPYAQLILDRLLTLQPAIVILNRHLVKNPCDATIFSNPAGRSYAQLILDRLLPFRPA